MFRLNKKVLIEFIETFVVYNNFDFSFFSMIKILKVEIMANPHKLFVKILVILLFLNIGCDNPERDNSDFKSDNESIEGIYRYSDSNIESEIIISGNKWRGKIVIKSGLGSLNDDTEYDNGIVQGTILYESSGTIQIGYVRGMTLATSIGEKRLTLRKL